jgi:hypothetical protein
MDQLSESVYLDLYAKRDLGDFRWVRDVIDEVVRTYKDLVVRADAKFFLLINFVEMIAIPLSKAAKMEREKLEFELRHDLMLILDTARQELTRAERKLEVSGHAIVSAVSKLWSDLELMRPNFWG